MKIGDAFEAEYCKSGILPGDVLAVKTELQSGNYLKFTESTLTSTPPFEIGVLSVVQVIQFVSNQPSVTV